MAFNLALIGYVFFNFAMAHQGHHDVVGDSKVAEAPTLVQDKVNQKYIQNVKPIFQNKCLACHGGSPEMPWYFRIPFVHGMIVDDMSEAKKHLDFAQDFPFKGHGTTSEDLEAIKSAVINREMPPGRYLFMHPQSKLSQGEIDMITNWVDESLSDLGLKKN